MPRRNNSIRIPKKPASDLAACRSKRRYSSETAAREATERARDERNAEVSYYRCAYCGGWHLTSNRTSRTKREH